MEKSHTFIENNGGLQRGSIVLVKNIPSNTPTPGVITPTPGFIMLADNDEYRVAFIVNKKLIRYKIPAVEINTYLEDKKFIYTNGLDTPEHIKELIEFLSTNNNVNNLYNYPHISTAPIQPRPRPRPTYDAAEQYHTADSPQYIPDEGGYSAKSIRRRRKSRRHKKTNYRRRKSNRRKSRRYKK